MKTKTAAHLLDIRLRDRLIASGRLDPKTLEEHLTKLPDLEAQGEAIPVSQPAIGDPDDDEDDEDEDDEDDEDE